MDYETLRPLTLEAMKERFKAEPVTNIIQVVDVVERLAISRGLYQVSRPSPGVEVAARMPEEDRETVRQILWDLTLEGIVYPGNDAYQADLHFLRITRYGREALEKGYPSPYDPEGYLGLLKREIPAIDPIIFLYMTESLQTFLRGNLLASTVMLGGASEKAILLLIDQYIAAVSPPRKATVQKKFDESFTIIKKFELLRKEFEPLRPTLRKAVADDLEIQLDGVFNSIRNARNDAGHPSAVKVERVRAFANLQLFVEYCKVVYALIAYFQPNSVP